MFLEEGRSPFENERPLGLLYNCFPDQWLDSSSKLCKPETSCSEIISWSFKLVPPPSRVWIIQQIREFSHVPFSDHPLSSIVGILSRNTRRQRRSGSPTAFSPRYWLYKPSTASWIYLIRPSLPFCQSSISVMEITPIISNIKWYFISYSYSGRPTGQKWTFE